MKAYWWTAACVPVLVASLSVPMPRAAAGEPKFGGAEAADMDWAVINCEFKATEKERQLADAGNATGSPAHQKALQEQRAKLRNIATPTAIASRCEEMKSLYGPAGSKIAGLLTWPQAGPPPTTVGKSTSSDTGRKGGGKRRGGGGT